MGHKPTWADTVTQAKIQMTQMKTLRRWHMLTHAITLSWILCKCVSLYWISKARNQKNAFGKPLLRPFQDVWWVWNPFTLVVGGYHQFHYLQHRLWASNYPTRKKLLPAAAETFRQSINHWAAKNDHNHSLEYDASSSILFGLRFALLIDPLSIQFKLVDF